MKRFFRSPNSKQKTAENQLHSSEMNMDNSVSQPGPIQFNTSLPLSCNELMLSPFIQAYCNENYKPLFELINGTDEEKVWRWKIIYEEWSWLMKNEDGDNLFDLANRILQLKTQITFVDYAVFYLDKRWDVVVAEKLCLIYPAGSPEYYKEKKNLQRTLTLVDTKRYELEILSDEYVRLQGVNKGEKTTEKDFNANIARLSKHQGYKIDKVTTTVAEYAAIHQSFLSEIKNTT